MSAFKKQDFVLRVRHKHENAGYVFNLSGMDSQVESSIKVSDATLAAVLSAKQHPIFSLIPFKDEDKALESERALEPLYEFIKERVKLPIFLQGKLELMRGALLRGYGAYIYEKILPIEVRFALESLCESSSIVLDIDEKSSPIPWELAFDGQSFLHSKFSCGRSSQTSDAQVLSKTFSQGRFLIVANPTGDLPEAMKETNYIMSQLRVLPQLQMTRIGYEMTKKRFLDLLRNSDYSVIHYSGHSVEYADNSEKSHFLFRDGPCYATDIRAVLSENPPLMVFANSCLSAAQLQSGTTSLADSFLHAGVSSFVGTLWPISDIGSAMLASDFYRLALHGNTIGEALRRARLASFRKWGYHDIVWSSFVLFGDPKARLIAKHD